MIVLDCCAAMEMVQKTPRGRVFRGLMVEGERVVAPEFFKIELRNSLWKYAAAGRTDSETIAFYTKSALALVDEFVPTDVNIDEAYAEAVLRKHPVYDMLYATLARRRACAFFTADKKLMRLCEEMGVNAVMEVTWPYDLEVEMNDGDGEADAEFGEAAAEFVEDGGEPEQVDG